MGCEGARLKAILAVSRRSCAPPRDRPAGEGKRNANYGRFRHLRAGNRTCGPAAYILRDPPSQLVLLMALTRLDNDGV